MKPGRATTRLAQFQIASPCRENWSGMPGDERVRHCGRCQLNVYNISELTEPEAVELTQKSEGRLCIRLFRRPDGTVLTFDCPSRFRSIRRSASAAALLLGLFGCDALKSAEPVHEMGTQIPIIEEHQED